MTATSDLGLEIAFSPRWWTFISSTRIFVESFCGHSIGKGAFSDKVALATHELLENAAKYSIGPEAVVRCTVSLEGRQVRVRVQNQAHPAHLPILVEELASIQDGDPLEVYVHKMQRSVTQAQSQLGLSRIRYESGAQLHLEVRDDWVTLEACFFVPEMKG
jgi:hypothetical protein